MSNFDVNNGNVFSALVPMVVEQTNRVKDPMIFIRDYLKKG